jgi:hypothetical protein
MSPALAAGVHAVHPRCGARTTPRRSRRRRRLVVQSRDLAGATPYAGCVELEAKSFAARTTRAAIARSGSGASRPPARPARAARRHLDRVQASEPRGPTTSVLVARRTAARTAARRRDADPAALAGRVAPDAVVPAELAAVLVDDRAVGGSSPRRSRNAR